MNCLFSYPLWDKDKDKEVQNVIFVQFLYFLFSFQAMFSSMPFIFDEMFYLICIVYS